MKACTAFVEFDDAADESYGVVFTCSLPRGHMGTHRAQGQVTNAHGLIDYTLDFGRYAGDDPRPVHVFINGRGEEIRQY